MLSKQDQAEIKRKAELWVKAEVVRVKVRAGFEGLYEPRRADAQAVEAKAKFLDSLKEVG